MPARAVTARIRLGWIPWSRWAPVDTPRYSSGMMIPVTEPEAASGRRASGPTSTPAAKRERLLVAATEVFARDGLDAPMSVVADAAGAGVASVYRLFESKRELLAALVVRRMDSVAGGGAGGVRVAGGPLVGADRDADQPGERAARRLPDRRCTRRRRRPPRRDRRGHAGQRGPGAAARRSARRGTAARRRDRRWTCGCCSPPPARPGGVEPDQWQRMLELMIDALDAERGTGRALTLPADP